MKPSLRVRMLLAYLLGTALLLAGVAAGIASMNRALATYEKEVAGLSEARVETLAALAAFKTQTGEWRSLLLRGYDAGLRDKHWQAFEKQEKLVQEKIARLLGRLPASDARRLLKNFGDAHRQLGAAYRQGLAAFAASNYDAKAGDQASAGIDRVSQESLDQAVEAMARLNAEYEQKAAGVARSAQLIAAVLTILVALGGVAVFYTLIHMGIIAPLRDLLTQIQRLTSGEFSQPVSVRAKGEIGELAASVEGLRQQLGQLVNNARQSSNALKISSIELRAAADAFVESIEHDSRSSSSLASATEQMSAAIRAVEEKTQAIQANALSAAEKTRAGNERLHELASSLAGVNQLMGEISKSVSGFVASTRCINGMSRQLREIADQTSLLSLNAAIEASRVGNSSRGFAVVVEEVRKLARGSARAAQEIDNLTQRLTAYSTRVEAVLQRGRSQLTAGLLESQAVDRSLLQALEAVTSAADGIAAIVQSVRQQASGIELVSSAAVSVASESQRNSATVGRIREAIKQMQLFADHQRRSLASPRQWSGAASK